MSPERRQRLPAQYFHHCFPWEMSSERRSQKLHTDDASLVLLIGRAAWKICFNKSEALPDLRNDTSSVWSFCVQTSFSGETIGGVGKWWLLSSVCYPKHFWKWKRSTFPPVTPLPLDYFTPARPLTSVTTVTSVGWEYWPYFLCWQDLHHL